MKIFFITWVLCGLFSAVVFLKEAAQINGEIVLLDIFVALMVALFGYISMIISLVVLSKDFVVWREK